MDRGYNPTLAISLFAGLIVGLALVILVTLWWTGNQIRRSLWTSDVEMQSIPVRTSQLRAIVVIVDTEMASQTDPSLTAVGREETP